MIHIHSKISTTGSVLYARTWCGTLILVQGRARLWLSIPTEALIAILYT